MSHDEERASSARVGNVRERAPRHWLNPLVGSLNCSVSPTYFHSRFPPYARGFKSLYSIGKSLHPRVTPNSSGFDHDGVAKFSGYPSIQAPRAKVRPRLCRSDRSYHVGAVRRKTHSFSLESEQSARLLKSRSEVLTDGIPEFCHA